MTYQMKACLVCVLQAVLATRALSDVAIAQLVRMKPSEGLRVTHAAGGIAAIDLAEAYLPQEGMQVRPMCKK